MASSNITTLTKAFGIVVARLRKNQKMNQETLSFESGLTRTYVSLIERGLASPTLNTIDALALSLNVDAAALVKLALLEKQTQLIANSGTSSAQNDA
jgi:transcriptional regulator with XRE-family HTH domain